MPSAVYAAAVCTDATILVSVPEAHWPLFAAHIELTADLSLMADPALLDHLGWDYLGTSVRIFALMTAEAAAEARAVPLDPQGPRATHRADTTQSRRRSGHHNRLQL